MILATPRLRLVAATPFTARADLGGREVLQAALGVTVPDNWPPDLYDAPAIQAGLRWLESDPEAAAWGFYYIVRCDQPGVEQLAGIVGFKGKPSIDGTVEIGYSVLQQHQRCGIATEAARALIEYAFGHPSVVRVIAETLPGLAPSIGVLEKLGFRFIGAGSEPGVIRYELCRDE